MKKLNLNLEKIFPIILSIIIIICTLIFSYFSSYTAIIKNTKSQYYKAKILLISGNMMICLESDKKFNTRSYVQNYKNEKYTLSIQSMLDIQFIEIIPEEEKDSADEVWTAPEKHLGTYSIYVSGHTGILYFYTKNNKTHGILRFPNWAKGVNEYLQGVQISSKKIRFMRSITNLTELQRVGAKSYFTQKFYGDFSKNGRSIKGVYYNNGIKSIWEANKIE